jgi:hypothetical protein
MSPPGEARQRPVGRHTVLTRLETMNTVSCDED